MTQLLHTGFQQLRLPPHDLHEKKRIKIPSMGKIRVPNAHPREFNGGQWLLRKRILLMLNGSSTCRCMPIQKALPRLSYSFHGFLANSFWACQTEQTLFLLCFVLLFHFCICLLGFVFVFIFVFAFSPFCCFLKSEWESAQSCVGSMVENIWEELHEGEPG